MVETHLIWSNEGRQSVLYVKVRSDKIAPTQS